MNRISVDILIVGAGPVGLMCAYLGQLCGLSVAIIDKTDGPLEVGRADALNARTLQLFEMVGLFSELYPLGKACNTSSVWSNGRFLSRESSWWDNLEGCFHKHFLMLGQSYVEQVLDKKMRELGVIVRRLTTIEDIQINDEGCLSILSSGDMIQSKYLIGADGSRSFVRNHFHVPFEIERPQIIWAVIDGIIESDFQKVPEIIVFQTDTSDVAWIPREGEVDRFYVRMDTKDFNFEDALVKIRKAISPHSFGFKKIIWFSHFSVKESVAEKFCIKDRVFLAGDSCHIHSVNGGQGLNTGLADAFNLIWKLNMVIRFASTPRLLESYELERQPIAKSVIDTSGELVRSTKYSKNGTHAQDYVKIIEKRAGNITGMGIRYGNEGFTGTRLFDFEIYQGTDELRIYSLLDYTKFNLIIISDSEPDINIPDFIKLIRITMKDNQEKYWTNKALYSNLAVLVRPDSYIESLSSVENAQMLVENLKLDF